MLVHGQIQLGHDGVGAADAAVCADDAAGNKLLIGAVEHHKVPLAAGGDTGILEHLDVLRGHGAVLHSHYIGVLEHFLQQAHGQAGACQLRDVVDDELGVGSSSGHIVPVFCNGVLRQVEVDGRNGCNGIHAHALGMAGQLHAVGGIVAADMCNDGQLALGFAHHGFQNGLALIHVLVDALAGGTAYIHALDAFGDQMAGKGLDALGRNIALCVVAGVKGGDDTLIFFDIFHVPNPSLKIVINTDEMVLHQARTLSVPGSGISALLRCPASASALGRALRLADRCAKNPSLHAPFCRCATSSPGRGKSLPAGGGRDFSP